MGISLDFFADAKPFKHFVRSQEHEIGPTVTVGTKLRVAKTMSVNWLFLCYLKISLMLHMSVCAWLFLKFLQKTVVILKIHVGFFQFLKALKTYFLDQLLTINQAYFSFRLFIYLFFVHALFSNLK